MGGSEDDSQGTGGSDELNIAEHLFKEQSVNARLFYPRPPSPLYWHDSGSEPSGTPRYKRSGVLNTPSAIIDIDQLKAHILAAESGTGEVARIIKGASFTPRHNAFTILLQLANKSRQPEKAVEIFEAMQSIAGITPNTYSYSALISALARVGNWQAAERYFQELTDKAKVDPRLEPNTVTWAALISAYEKGRQLEKAFATFQEQLRKGVEADVITYASLLSACERAGDMDRAVSLLDTMHEQGLVGPSQMYNSVIAACGARWQRALETFLGMQYAGVVVTAQTVNLLMASLCSGGQRDHAVWLLRQSISTRLSLSLTSYTSLLCMLAASGDYKAADAVHLAMLAAKQQMDASAAGFLIKAHRSGGDSAGAEKLLEQLSKSVGISLKHHIIEYIINYKEGGPTAAEGGGQQPMLS